MSQPILQKRTIVENKLTVNNSAIPEKCPKCGVEPFATYMRGQIARPEHPWYWPFGCRPTHTIICADCLDIVGHEWHRVVDPIGTGHLSKADAGKVFARGYSQTFLDFEQGLLQSNKGRTK